MTRISQLMAVPLIQGTLRYAYVQDKQSDRREKEEAEGATFAAAVLPLVNSCSPADAGMFLFCVRCQFFFSRQRVFNLYLSYAMSLMSRNHLQQHESWQQGKREL